MPWVFSMHDVITEIKDKLSIEDLVSQYVQLKKAGRSLKGLCPFHSEKTPSFVVSPDRGIAYCFGCHKGGDIFAFLQEVEGVDFKDALRILAERSGVKLEDKVFDRKNTVSSDQKQVLIDLHEKVTVFYENQLWQTDDGAKVLAYLKKRGLTEESIRFFRLGFAPDSYERTYSFLLKEGFTRQHLMQAGLALTQETTVEKIYDRFRGRLMFPILDSLGRVVAFGGRALRKGQDPKYLNSPETPLYHKSRILYGFYQAKQAIKQNQTVMVVEGYMDLIATYQAGIKNVVASSGTAVTQQHLRLLQPFVTTLYLSFDMDLAGQEAAKRTFELTQDFNFITKVVTLPEGKDPADFAQHHGAEFAQLLEQSPPYIDYSFQHLLKVYGIETLSAKKKILEEFFPLFQLLKSSIEKDAYIRKLAAELSIDEVVLYDEIRKMKLPAYHPARKLGALSNPPPQAKTYRTDEIFIGFLLAYPRLAHFFMDKLEKEFFEEELQPIYNTFVNQYNAQGAGIKAVLLSDVNEDVQSRAHLLALSIEEKYGESPEEIVIKVMGDVFKSMKKSFLDKKGKELAKKIAEAEKAGNKTLRNNYLEETNRIHH